MTENASVAQLTKLILSASETIKITKGMFLRKMLTEDEGGKIVDALASLLEEIQSRLSQPTPLGENDILKYMAMIEGLRNALDARTVGAQGNPICNRSTSRKSRHFRHGFHVAGPAWARADNGRHNNRR